MPFRAEGDMMHVGTEREGTTLPVVPMSKKMSLSPTLLLVKIPGRVHPKRRLGLGCLLDIPSTSQGEHMIHDILFSPEARR